MLPMQEAWSYVPRMPWPRLHPHLHLLVKDNSRKGKNRREVVEEDDEEKADESEEEQPKKQERKKVRKAKATPSIASSSRTPIIETDEEEEPPSYQAARASIIRTLAQFPSNQRSQLADSLADDEGF